MTHACQKYTLQMIVVISQVKSVNSQLSVGLIKCHGSSHAVWISMFSLRLSEL